MISFDVYDARSLVENCRGHDLSREAKSALFRTILETGRSMLATVGLMYSDNMKDGSLKKDIEIRIIGIRKGLKNLILGRVIDS
jgi:hypothetical protein